MKKIDIVAALVIGEVSAWLMMAIFENIRISSSILWVLPIILPLFSLAGLVVAYFIGKKIPVMWQAAKFILVGILNTLLDLGVLNLLLFTAETSSGGIYTFFKGISFSVAVINSYFWNKLWTFKKSEEGLDNSKTGKELLQFFIVSVIGFGINVGIATFVVNTIGSQFGLSDVLWANIGAISATVASMVWNFLGYKFVVFKK